MPGPPVLTQAALRTLEQDPDGFLLMVEAAAVDSGWRPAECQREFWSNNHTNELVPVRAHGPGASAFEGLVDGVDPVRGAYVDDTDVHTVMSLVLENEPSPCGDGDDSGTVGFGDLVAVLANFGGTVPEGDADGSGTVDFTDVTIVLVQLGGSCG